MVNFLCANHVAKKLKDREIIKDVSLTLEGGHVYGFVGENGSGKTMLFRILSGLVRPTQGEIFLNQKELYRDKTAHNIGVIIENSLMWADLSGLENLMLLASIKQVIQKKDVIRALERVGLEPYNSLPIKKYSLGMKQRILIAQAIMEAPDFLFLDEPTNAIDKDGIELIHRIIKEESQRGAVVLLASHISSDISSLCEEIYLMENGYCKRRGENG
ncbi:MAG: ABC transporter ATP-binding protein [Oscillospiraceae bacterium]|nr:ABC transporter ATP-binding protein [Oscillospiraceae bacterium]